MPRSRALCRRAMASASVNLPHQPVETVHIPKPTSDTFKLELRRTRYFIKEEFTLFEFGLANLNGSAGKCDFRAPAIGRRRRRCQRVERVGRRGATGRQRVSNGWATLDKAV